MKPTDQLTVLEAIALGYALAGKEQAAKVFALLPPSEWIGPLGGVARSVSGKMAGSYVDLEILGITGKPGLASCMKAIMDELIVAETDRRRKQLAMGLRGLADKMLDAQLPGPNRAEMPAALESIIAEARGIYGKSERTTTSKNAASGELAKAPAKAPGGHSAASAATPKV